MPAEAVLSRAAEARLRQPRTRGAFAPIDAARRELGLLAVADGAGQARLSWLVDLPTGEVRDSRFLAFGDLASHPVADVLCEQARGRTVADACRLTAEQLELLLRDDPGTPAFGDAGLAPLAFVADLQARLLAALPAVKLLPKPVEKPVYQRKRKQEWTPADEAWLPLSLLRKVGKVDALLKKALADRVPGASHRVEGLHDDFRVALRLDGVAAEQRPMVAQMLTDAIRPLHAGLTVELV